MHNRGKISKQYNRTVVDTPIKDLWPLFMASKRAQGVAPATMKSYKYHLSAMNKYYPIGDVPINELSSFHTDQMINNMFDHLSKQGIRTLVISLRAFLHWCAKNDFTDFMIPTFKAEEVIKTPYTDDELRLLLKKPRGCFSTYRTWVIINVLVNCGCRAMTIRTFLNKDVDFKNKVIYTRHTKSGKLQPLPIADIIPILKEYMDIRKGEPCDYLFCNENGEMLSQSALRCAVADYNRSRGVEKTSIHLFRHTFAKKYLMECGGNAFTLQKLLGHSTLDMTKRYCNIYDRELIEGFVSPLSTLH